MSNLVTFVVSKIKRGNFILHECLCANISLALHFLGFEMILYSTATDFFSTPSAPLDERDTTAREIFASDGKTGHWKFDH